MTKTMTAAAALVLGVAVAAGAQAHGTMHQSMQRQHRAVQSGSSMPPQQMQQATQRRPMSKRHAMQLQRKLRADGLYRGRIDGVVGPKTRQAVAKLQQRQGATGFGSSMPNRTRRNPTLNTNQDQSLNNGTTLPQTDQSTAGSGSSTLPQNQNLQSPNQQNPNQYNQKQQ